MRVKQVLAKPAIIAVAALLAFVLTLPSLGNGLAIDDHLYRARIVDDHWSPGRSARDLFMFASPDRAGERQAEIESGELSWWAAPTLRWGFMRPLPALVHHAEWHAFGRGGTAWMHLHSVLWMAALAAAVALLYRRLLGATWIAGLAAVLYAIDDGHGFAVGWLANRCGIMGACFAVLALAAHDRWRRQAWRGGAVAAPVLVALALLCSEQMVAVCGFLAAYAWFLDAKRGRFASVAPYAVLTVAWYVVRASLGYGSVGTGSYTDPFREPLGYLGHVLERVPILVHSQMGALPADLWEVFFVRHGLSWVMVAAGGLFLAILALGYARLVRVDPVARFWAVGGLGALVVVCGAHPNDRHLLLVGVAGSALVAQLCGAWIDRDRSRLPARGAGVLAVFLLFVHAVAAPVLLPVRARIPGSVSRGVERIDTLVPADPALAGQDLVLVNVPFKYLCNFASVVRRSNGGVSPKHWRCLGVSPDDVDVRRTDERTLVLRPRGGYLRFFEDSNVRARAVPFSVGEHVDLDGLTITVKQITDDGRPAEVEFRFAVPLDDASLRWLVWRDGAYRPFLPATLTLPAQHFAFGDLLEEK